MKILLITTFTIILILTSATLKGQIQPQKPVRIAIAGMTVVSPAGILLSAIPVPMTFKI